MSDKGNPYMEEAVAKLGTKPSNGKVLVLMPISGVALRFAGTYFVREYDKKGTKYRNPAVLLKDGTPHNIDPRCLVFDDGTLARLWHPRLEQESIDPVAAEWLHNNPDVFKVAGVEPAADLRRPEGRVDLI